jgi:steroid delta-isomerase-like uncharacterized protein
MATNNKALFNEFYDAMNTRDADLIAKAIDEFVAPDVVFHTPIPMPEKGAEALRWVWSELLRGFPDIHVEVADLIAEGDRVVSRNTVTGTHRGEFRGIPATGKPVHYNEIFIVRFAGGRIAEIWGVVDVLTQLRQLGQLAA